MTDHLFSVDSDHVCDEKLKGLIHEEDDVEKVSWMGYIDHISLQTYQLLIELFFIEIVFQNV